MTEEIQEPSEISKAILDNETYIGDGLYVSFDGYQYRLRAPREDGDHFIFMEQSVLDNFIRYVEFKKKGE